MKDFLFKERFNFSLVELILFGIVVDESRKHPTFGNIAFLIGISYLAISWVYERTGIANAIWFWWHDRHGIITSYRIPQLDRPMLVCDQGHVRGRPIRGSGDWAKWSKTLTNQKLSKSQDEY